MREFISLDRLTRCAALAVAVFSATAGSVNASWRGTQTWMKGDTTSPAYLNNGTVIKVDRSNVTNVAGETNLSQGSGGEFTISLVSGAVSGPTVSSFYTFCVEAGENIGIPENVRVAGISSSSQNSNVTLKAGTSALYREFLANKGLGPLFGITSNSNSVSYSSNADAEALQKAIWYFQGQAGGVNNAFAQAATAALGGGLNGFNLASSLTGTAFDNWGGVQILNLVKINANGSDGFNNTETRQDMLVYRTSTPPTGIIPEPATFALFGIGILGFLAGSRQKRS